MRSVLAHIQSLAQITDLGSTRSTTRRPRVRWRTAHLANSRSLQQFGQFIRQHHPVFFGRYTDEETSNVNFLFPGAYPTVPLGGPTISPMSSAAVLGLDTTSYTMWLLDANPPTKFLSFAKGSRRGEEILLTNVVSFDVKLWDNNYSELAAGFDVNRNGVIDTTAAFADLGHTATGDYAQAKNAFPVYGPNIDTGYAVPAFRKQLLGSGVYLCKCW